MFFVLISIRFIIIINIIILIFLYLYFNTESSHNERIILWTVLNSFREYDVATPEDLFDAISEKIEDEKIKNLIPDIMNSWTTQSGYPVVHANQNGNYLLLRQERFFLDRDEESSESLWHIPITWVNLNRPNFSDTKTKHWFKRVQETIILPSNHLYLLNVRQAGK